MITINLDVVLYVLGTLLFGAVCHGIGYTRGYEDGK